MTDTDQPKNVEGRARAEILKAATRVFAEHGFQGATTGQIADAAGVSTALVFKHFTSKENLLEALMQQWQGEALRYYDENWQDEDPGAQLRTLLDYGVGRAVRYPDLYRLYFSLSLQPGGAAALQRVLEPLQAGFMRYFQRLEQLMGALGSDAPKADAQLFQIAMNGLAQTIATEPKLLDDRSFSLAGLKARLLAKFGG